MPFRFKTPYGKSNTKKVYKSKKKSQFKRQSAVTKWKNNVPVGIGFPKKMCMTHKYHEVVGLTSTTGVANYFKVFCNNLYDPNYTGTGHQPMYFDQLSAIYDHYTVIGSKISVKVTPTTGSSVPFFVTLAQNDDVTATGGIDANAEYSSNRSTILFGPSSNQVRYLSNKWSAKKTFGGSILGNDNLQGTGTTAPNEVTMWFVGLQAADGVSTQSVILEISVEYIAVWDELKDIVSS